MTSIQSDICKLVSSSHEGESKSTDDDMYAVQINMDIPSMFRTDVKFSSTHWHVQFCSCVAVFQLLQWCLIRITLIVVLNFHAWWEKDFVSLLTSMKSESTYFVSHWLIVTYFIISFDIDFFVFQENRSWSLIFFLSFSKCLILSNHLCMYYLLYTYKSINLSSLKRKKKYNLRKSKCTLPNIIVRVSTRSQIIHFLFRYQKKIDE